MEDQCSPLAWAYCFQDDGIEELKHSLLYSTLELEATVLSAREELSRKDDEICHLKVLLTKTAKERDEAISKCQRLMLEKLFFQQKLHIEVEAAPTSGATTSNEDEPRRADSYAGLSSSDCDENIVASPGTEYSIPKPASAQALADVMEKIVPKKPLPQKGKFLQAVMEAGPLLQTLLLAGPLPQWQHPPPQLSSIDIPPVTVSSPRPRLPHQDSCLGTSTSTIGCLSKKRAPVNSAELGADSSPNSKYQRVVHQSSLTNI